MLSSSLAPSRLSRALARAGRLGGTAAIFRGAIAVAPAAPPPSSSSSSSYSSSSFSTSASAPPVPPAFHSLREDTQPLAAHLAAGRGAEKALLYFTASWCGPCRAVAPAFASVAAAPASASIAFVKIDVDENPAAAEAHDVRAVPTFKSLHKGAVLRTFSGANVQALKDAVAELAAK
jgi:thiol-disulfide isomerase/thioredoxin